MYSAIKHIGGNERPKFDCCVVHRAGINYQAADFKYRPTAHLQEPPSIKDRPLTVIHVALAQKQTQICPTTGKIILTEE